MRASSSSGAPPAMPVSAKGKGKGVARPRQAAGRQQTGSTGFSPSFPALDEDPSGLQLEGWLALEDESGALLRRFELQRRAVLILGQPTPADVDLLIDSASPATILILPKPSDASVGSRPKPSPRVTYLRTTVSEGGLGRVFEEVISLALKWKKACPTRRPASWFGSTRSSGMGPPASPPLAKARSDRPLDVVLHYVYDQAPPLSPTYPAAGASAQHMSHKRTASTQSVNLQGMLSAAFLVTTASLPFLATRSSTGLSSSASSTVRRPAPAVLSASSSRPSSVSSTASSRLPTAASMSDTFSSSSFAGRTLGDAPDAVLAHVLPLDVPAHLPHLLDGFMQTFIATNPSVLLAIVPSNVLAASPDYHEPDPSSPASDGSPAPPSILQLLLASAVRPPLPPLPSLARSRRGSASSMQSLRSGTTASALSTISASRPTEGLLSYISSVRAISFVTTALPTSTSASSSAYPSPATPCIALTPPSPSTPTFAGAPRSDTHGLPQSAPPVPDLVASSSSSSSTSDEVTSLPPPSIAGRKALKSRGSFASLSTASAAGSGGERKAKSGGFWSRMFGRSKA